MAPELNRVNKATYKVQAHRIRIESFWGILHKESMEFWIQVFSGLKDEGGFDGSFLDKALLQFCFMGIIQEELDQVKKKIWNAHNIRPSRNENVPYGRPVAMYLVPELWGTPNYLNLVDVQDLQLCKQMCTFRCPIPCNEDVFDLYMMIMEEHNLSFQNEAFGAVELYTHLRTILMSLL
ncbi:hypothetical protein EOD39_4163 [Acipenser ruthenus]|uniref:Integrase core domain-containing protein n=1 Tax=Acipenser ruthenus TaxID=7906 RepID=A0A444UJJ3_ACIRT|nr:hypothetical protein EOD39_4163 [Acipenser ruthenus]